MGSTYSMQKRADGWVISVGDNQILKCSKRATAICVIQQAAYRLEIADDVPAPSSDDPDDQPGEAERIRRIA